MLSLTEKEVEQLAHQLMKGKYFAFISSIKKINYRLPDERTTLNYDLLQTRKIS